MKFRKETAEKKRIRQVMGMLLAVTVLLAGTPYTAVAADIVKDTDGTAYAQDAEGFVYQIPKGATTKKKAVLFICIRGRKLPLHFRKNVMLIPLPVSERDLSQLILTNLCTVKIPSGYTTIENLAFQNQTQLYRIEIPASVKND